MGKVKKKQQKNDQRSVRHSKKSKNNYQQRQKKCTVDRKNDQRSELLLNEKVVELGTISKEIVADDVVSEDGNVAAKGEAGDAAIEDQEEGQEADIKSDGEAELGTDSQSEPSESNVAVLKPTFGQRLHALNVDYPWLKVVCIIFLFAIVVTVLGLVISHNMQQKTTDEGGTAQVVDGEMSEHEGGVDDEKAPDGSTEVDSETTETPETPAETKPEGEAPNTVTPPPETPPRDVPAGSRLIALTFDDGPSAATTPRLLDILAQKQVKATFFVLGSMAQRAPDIVRREEAEGHEVASHTPWHNNQRLLSAADIRSEGDTMNQIFMEILGHGPAFTRPPYGEISQALRDNLAQPLILWSIDPEDWKYRNAATVRYNVVSAAYDGAIILVHDIHSTTVDAIPGIIDDLRAQGYEFLTVSELARARGVALVNGASYYYFKP